jgi:hypothetical protein
MKTVKFPGGNTQQESVIIGAERQVRVDLSRGTLRVHDGITPGGFELPNLEIVTGLITGNNESNQVVDFQYCATESALKDLVPTPNMIAIVNESGLEDLYTWKATASDGGGVTSNVSGWWHRTDSSAGFYVRLYRAGIINMQINGSAPAVNQDITAWLTNNVAKLWDGAAYQVSTPLLFARLMSKVGSYASTVIFPDRLADILVEAPDLDLVTDTGWYKSKTSDAHAPTTTVSPVYHTKIDANTMSQRFELQASATRDSYVRFKAAGTWGAWVLVPGVLDARLAAVSSLITDANTGLDSGFYHLTSAASNIPVAVNGTIISNRYSSTEATQIWMATGSSAIYVRQFAASVWSSWTAVGSTHALTLKGSIVDADELGGADSAASFAGVRWTFTTLKTYLSGFYQAISTGLGRGTALIGIMAAKAMVGPARLSNAFVDGFATADGQNVARSSNTLIDTGLGCVGPSYSYTTVTPIARTGDGAYGTSGFTEYNYGTALTTGVTITHLGIYSTGTNLYALKIGKRNSAANWDCVVTQWFAHPGGGLQYVELTTPFVVPAGNNYYQGAYVVGAAGVSTTTYNRAQIAGNQNGNGVVGWTESVAAGLVHSHKHTPVAQNMTHSVAVQTADAAVTRVTFRGYLNAIDALTLDTDLIGKITSNNWAANTVLVLTQVGIGQDGLAIIEGTGTGTSGTQYAAELVSANAKRFQIYGIEVEAA